MKILVAGASGQVARSLIQQASRHAHDVIAIGRPGLDLADEGSLSVALDSSECDLVINAAAYTAVDQAEEEEDLAFSINAEGAGRLAHLAAKRDLPILHISTDYVFDGESSAPYKEEMPVSPLGAYGRSKLAGEIAIASNNPRHLIFRTAWVYSPFGKNFVKTMMRLANKHDEVSVVADQVGSPTSALDFAEAILSISSMLAPSFNRWGIYHLAGSGYASWAQVAEEVFRSSSRGGGASAVVNPITTADYPTPAKRPANSRLATDKLYETFGVRLPDWSNSVLSCVQSILHTPE